MDMFSDLDLYQEGAAANERKEDRRLVEARDRKLVPRAEFKGAAALAGRGVSAVCTGVQRKDSQMERVLSRSLGRAFLTLFGVE